MGVRYIVLDGGKVVIEKWVGNVSHAEVINHEKEQCNDQSIAQGAVVIVDAREAVFPQTTSEGLREFACVLAEPDNKTKFSRFALMVAGEIWEKVKTLESETEERGVRIIMFSDLDIACTWLGLDTKNILEALRVLTSDNPDAGDG